MNKPQNLQGFRDFLPAEKRKRDFVTAKIKQAFEVFGFEPLETPTLEYASLLLGKYGTEADKLVYTFKDRGDREVGLRYDQTVPSARVLAQYQSQLPKFFRRYQIQNVFRAEKTQKGRYREFTQCDIDIFGSTSKVADAEILATTYVAYKNIGFPNIKLRINDRETLVTAVEPFATEKTHVFSIIQTIDKLDKLSEAEVIDELVKKGLKVKDAMAVITQIQAAVESENLKEIIDLALSLGVEKEDLVFDAKLARGLDYYTGMIFEVSVPEYGSSSLGGGGRYDKLIEELGGVNIPAVGMAFGFDRTVEAADQLQLVATQTSTAKVLVTVFSQDLLPQSLQATTVLRKAKVHTEVYVSPGDKLEKQLKYASQKQIPYVAIIGPDEASGNKVVLKNMTEKTQETMMIDDVIDHLGPAK